MGLYANNTGSFNIAMGYNAAYGIFSAPRDYIIGIGYEALKWSKGDYNIGIGWRAGYDGVEVIIMKVLITLL